MELLRTSLVTVCVLAVLTGSGSAFECSRDYNPPPDYKPPPDQFVRLCGDKLATYVIKLCVDRGGIAEHHEPELLAMSLGDRHKDCGPFNRMGCQCCYHGPCTHAEIYEFCRCATVQPPMSPWGYPI